MALDCVVREQLTDPVSAWSAARQHSRQSLQLSDRVQGGGLDPGSPLAQEEAEASRAADNASEPLRLLLVKLGRELSDCRHSAR